MAKGSKMDQQNPGRWCERCKARGWHHTDRHDEFARVEQLRAYVEGDDALREKFRADA